MGSLVNVTDATFEQEVLKSDVPVLLDLWATWCGPCVAIAPALEELAAEYDGRFKIVKLDIDNNPATPSKLGVMSIPTLLVFKDGNPVDRHVGSAPKSTFKALLDKHL